MQIIYLDVDGVLNRYPSSWIEQNAKNTFVIDDRCTEPFIHLLDTLPECQVVMSSTWRLFTDQMNYLFTRVPQLRGRMFTRDRIPSTSEVPSWRTIDSLSGERSAEIGRHRRVYGLTETRCIAIDDTLVFSSEFPVPNFRFVRTEENVGFTEALAAEAFEFLSEDPVSV